jgi:hypothetical protein
VDRPGSGAGGVRFAAPSAHPAGVAPGPVAAGDFDRDSVADLAVGNGTPLGTVTVLPETRDGGLPSQPPAGGGPASVAVGEFAGDGDLDLVAGDANNLGGVTVLPGGPGGGFSIGGHVPGRASGQIGCAGGLQPRHRDPDLALAGGDGTVAVLLGGSGASFGRRRP